MEMFIDFPGGARVDAHFGPYTIMTDQPPAGGGRGEAPTPFALFLASLGTCAGIYVLGFCKQRNLPTDGIRILQRVHRDNQTGLIGQVDLEIQVPPSFPEKYRPSLIRSAQLCAVKKHLENQTDFEITTRVIEPDYSFAVKRKFSHVLCVHQACLIQQQLRYNIIHDFGFNLFMGN